MRNILSALAAALCLVVIAVPSIVADDKSPSPEQLQKLLNQKIGELEDKVRDLTERVARLEARIAAATEGPERERLAAEL